MKEKSQKEKFRYICVQNSYGKKMSVGYPLTPYSAAKDPCTVASTATTFASPASSDAASANGAAKFLQ